LAEWLRSGLQIRVHRFDSGTRLQLFQGVANGGPFPFAGKCGRFSPSELVDTKPAFSQEEIQVVLVQAVAPGEDEVGQGAPSDVHGTCHDATPRNSVEVELR
jgi:hypothetical protein